MKVGTDPRYPLQSRKGTRYYKAPSLKALWCRGPLEHHGSVASLEESLDPKRVDSWYVPGGYKGPDGKARGVQGHSFGLKLSEGDRAALLAFLRTF